MLIQNWVSRPTFMKTANGGKNIADVSIGWMAVWSWKSGSTKIVVLALKLRPKISLVYRTQSDSPLHTQNASDNLFAVHCWWREVVGSWRRKRRETRWWNVFVGATGPAASPYFSLACLGVHHETAERTSGVCTEGVWRLTICYRKSGQIVLVCGLGRPVGPSISVTKWWWRYLLSLK